MSAYVFISDHVQKSGLSTVYLRVIIDRKKKEFNLNLTWPQNFFNKERACALPRFKNDSEVTRVNLIIDEAKGRANKIQIRYFGNDRKLNLKLFEQEFINYMSGENFLYYWKRKADELEGDEIITPDTRKHQDTSYNRLLEFVGETEYLPFCDINLNYVQKFNAWLRKQKKLSYNSAMTTHKVVRTYLNHALADKFRFDYPYKKFTIKFRDGERDALDDEEQDRLKKLYHQNVLDSTGQEVLRKFIFSCYTGLRIADSSLVHRDMITNGKLRLEPEKGFNFGKVVNILLPDFALKIVGDRDGLLFKDIADQTCNKYLKIIGILAGIKKKLTFRVSRDTFGTTFIEMGGDIYHLMELMGHSDIRTTMIYIKLAEKGKDKQMQNFNKRDESEAVLLNTIN